MKDNAKIQRERRLLPEKRYLHIIQDCKKSDKKKGLEFNLTKPDVLELLKQGCYYCGCMDLIQLGLDRIDNSKGHTLDNVNTSCRRCNYIRRDMPYHAWLIISQAVKQVSDLGLFNNWTCFMDVKDN